MLRKYFAGLAGLIVAFSINLSAASADMFTVTDTEGREVMIHTPVERVLLGFYFEDFYAIVGPKAFDRVVAISKPTWRDWRNLQWAAYVGHNPRIDQLIDVGDIEASTFNIEAAIAAKPDIAIIAAWQYRGLGEAVGKLEAAGIPVVVADYNAQTVEKHVASTLLIGRVMDSNERAKKLADEYTAAVADVQERVNRAGGSRKRVYVELGNKGPGEYGNSYGKGMWAGVIALAGGENIAAGQVENWGPLNPEYVLASDPEVILVAGSDWTTKKKAVLMGFGNPPETTRERLRPYIKRPGWAELSAVKASQVHAVYHGGARTLYDYAYLQYIAKILHPEAFKDVDPTATLQRYYETWLPIKAEGSFMVKLD